ncbi:MAG TPA: hypothetical protein VGR81_00755 [Candidatus Acidoferrales bacterium]|nr:hypothetical protein [Candidatus Acidoferrales bacterium]
MRFSRAILLTAMAAALAVYSVDCNGMTTPEQAMQCCKSMPCSSHGHQGKNCCKTMEAMHAPFVLSSSLPAAGPSVAAVSFPASTASIVRQPVIGGIAARYHSPPLAQSLSLSPLRI